MSAATIFSLCGRLATFEPHSEESSGGDPLKRNKERSDYIFLRQLPCHISASQREK